MKIIELQANHREFCYVNWIMYEWFNTHRTNPRFVKVNEWMQR